MSRSDSLEIRRQLTIEDQTLIEGGKPLHTPIRKVAAIAVITNPFAERYVDDLAELPDADKRRILRDGLAALLKRHGTDIGELPGPDR